MKMHIVLVATLVITANSIIADASTKAKAGFDIIALGTGGGLDSNNLSAFLVGPHNQNSSIACDAGNLINGINSAVKAQSFDVAMRPPNYPLSLTGYILREYIKGYLITHGHLDHIAGLLIASPEDSSKPIYGIESVINTIHQTHFNWQSWPNFGDTGVSPRLAKYSYVYLAELHQVKMANNPMLVTALPLSHNGVRSSAFVIQYNEDVVLCIGDTGPDTIEESDKLKKVWQFIAPKVNKGKLKAIIIESSFLNDKPDNLLFGHLSPRYVLQELSVLASLVEKPELLKDLPIIISHIKPSLKHGLDVQKLMLEQLETENHLDLHFIIPTQGQRWHFQ